jgi:hypothetical protein
VARDDENPMVVLPKWSAGVNDSGIMRRRCERPIRFLAGGRARCLNLKFTSIQICIGTMTDYNQWGEMGEKSHKYELICRVNHAINLLIVGLWCPKSASIPGASLAILVATPLVVVA